MILINKPAFESRLVLLEGGGDTMRILVAAADDTLADYLRTAGHKAKTLYVNDLATRAAREFKADVIIYQTTVTATINHEDVIKELHDNGFRMVLIADPNDHLVIYVLALGIKDLLLFPLDPATILHRIENPATVDEVARQVRKKNAHELATKNKIAKEDKKNHLLLWFKRGEKNNHDDDEDLSKIPTLITPTLKVNTRKRKLAGNIDNADSLSGSFNGQVGLIDYSKNLIIVTGDKETEIYDHIIKTKKPTVAIDAYSGRIACKLGVEPNSMWEHDWRIGLAALPATVGKKVELYCNPIEQDIPDWEVRDVRAMVDIINSAIEKKKQVIIIAEEGLAEMLYNHQSIVQERS